MELLNIKKYSLPEQTFSSATNSAAIDATGLATLGLEVYSTIPPADTVFNSGESEVTELTFANKAGTAAGDYIVVYDTAGLAWAVAADSAPSGAIWTAIAAGRKGIADTAAATTAAEVAAAFELAFDALTAVPFTTDDSANDGTMLVTCVIRGNTTNAAPHNTDDSGAGSIAAAVDNAGVNSAVDVVANTITVTDHGYGTGQELEVSSTGTLPAPLVAATAYYVIRVDANTLQLAETLEDAEAGDEINLTTQGSEGAVNTLDVEDLSGGSATLQRSLGDPSVPDEADWVWFDDGNAVNITATGGLYFEKVNPTANYYRIKYAITTGSLTTNVRVLGKGLV